MTSKKNKDKPLRLEPQSIEAEKAVLGSMLISSEAIPRAMNILISESFFDSNHKVIYENIMELFEANKGIDSIL